MPSILSTRRGKTSKPRESQADYRVDRPVYAPWFAKVGWVMDNPQAEGRLEVLEQARREQEQGVKN